MNIDALSKRSEICGEYFDSLGSLPMGRKYKRSAERIGERYGSWTIIGVGELRGTQRRFECRCACGRNQLVLYAEIINGRSSQCRQCYDAKRRAAKTYCADCGRLLSSRSATRCRECNPGTPWKYPRSISDMASELGVSKQAVHYQITAYGWSGMIKWYRKKLANAG